MLFRHGNSASPDREELADVVPALEEMRGNDVAYLGKDSQHSPYVMSPEEDSNVKDLWCAAFQFAGDRS